MFRQKSSQEVLSIVQPNSAQLFSRVRIKELSQHLMEQQGEKALQHHTKRHQNKTGSSICQFLIN